MSILIKTGDTIAINYQLSDGGPDEDIVVKGILRGYGGNLIDTVTLTYIDDGLYKDTSLVMPDEPEVTVTIIPYDLDGVTELIDYSYGFDVYTNADIGGGGSSISIGDITKLAQGFGDAIDIVVDDENFEEIDIIID